MKYFLATPTIQRFIKLLPGQSFRVSLPTEPYTKYKLFRMRGALVVWQGGIDLVVRGDFTPEIGQTASLKFDARDLTTLGQFFTYPDNVFPVFQTGTNFNALKWAPAEGFTFKKLDISLINESNSEMLILVLMVIYEVGVE